VESVLLWESRRVEKASAIGSESQARRVVEALHARALELYGPPLAAALARHFAPPGGPERKKQYDAAKEFLRQKEPTMKSLESIDAENKAFRAIPLEAQLGSIFKSNPELYARYSKRAAGDRKDLRRGTEVAFDVAVGPVVRLFEKRGDAPIKALSKAYEHTPGAYSQRRFWADEVETRPLDVISRELMEAIKEVGEDALRLERDVASQVQKGHASEDLEAAIHSITHPVGCRW
jgi:hypothetical protein